MTKIKNNIYFLQKKFSFSNDFFAFICLTFILIVTSGNATSAQTLTLADAIKIAVNNNFNVQLSKNSQLINSNNNTIGNAGMLPTLNLNAGQTFNVTNTVQKPFTAPEVTVNNAHSNTFLAAATVNWTVFDGMQMFASKQQLDVIEKSGNVQLQILIEQTIADVIRVYSNIVLQHRFISALYETIKISIDRKTIAGKKKTIGTGSALSYNQSIVDLNNDSLNLLKQQISLFNAKVELNTILGRAAETNFEVDNTIDLINTFNYDSLANAIQSQNPRLQLARYNEIIAQQELRSQQSQRYPQLNLFGGFNFLKSEAETGFLQNNRSIGPNYGATLTYNIFNGFNVNRQVKNAHIEVQNSEISTNQTATNVNNEFVQAANEHKADLQILILEQSNSAIAKSNAEIALQQFKIGSITDVDFRETQVKAINAESALLITIFQTKVLETQLLRLSGNLK